MCAQCLSAPHWSGKFVKGCGELPTASVNCHSRGHRGNRVLSEGPAPLICLQASFQFQKERKKSFPCKNTSSSKTGCSLGCLANPGCDSLWETQCQPMLDSSGAQARQPVLWSGGAFPGFLRQLYHTHKSRFVTPKGVVVAIIKWEKNVGGCQNAAWNSKKW